MSDPAFLQDLDIAQKRSLIFREYERFRNEAQDEVKNMLGENRLGMLMLLDDIHECMHRHYRDGIAVALAPSRELCGARLVEQRNLCASHKYEEHSQASFPSRL